MFDEILIKEIMDIYAQGIKFGLLIGFPAFLLAWGFSIVFKLFKNISK